MTTQSHDEICARAHEVARAKLAPNAKRYDETAEFPVDNFRALGEAGLMGVLVPQAYGGLEASMETFVSVMEILGGACASTAMMYAMHHNQYIMLVDHGTAQQKESFLRPIAAGESLFASATTEPGTGGNADFCQSARRREGDEFVISAMKPVVSGANHADWVCLTTRSAPDAPGNDLSMVIVPGVARAGSAVRPFGVWDCVGMRATGSSGLEYIDCRVPTWHQIGPDNCAPVRSTSMAPVAALGFSGAWLGIAVAAYTAAVEHVTGRKHEFIGKPDRSPDPATAPRRDVTVRLADYEVVQRQIAELRVRIEATRALLRAAARRMDELRPSRTEPVPREAIPKLLELVLTARIGCGEAAIDVCRTALRISGVTGMRRGALPLERHMRDALTSQVMAPSEDLSKIMVGKSILGVI